MEQSQRKNTNSKTCRICFIADSSVIFIPCECSSTQQSGIHPECRQYWVNHIKKFHTDNLRNYKEYDEIDCEKCKETVVFPKSRWMECRSWQQIKKEKEIECMDIMVDVSLCIITLITFALLLYFTVMAYIDACEDECFASKIILTLFTVLIFIFFIYPLKQLVNLFAREQLENRALKKEEGIQKL